LVEECQSTQTADLFPPVYVKFSCRAAARLGKFALIGGKSPAARHPPIFKQGLKKRTAKAVRFDLENKRGDEMVTNPAP
jgi:hypothetical protein